MDRFVGDGRYRGLGGRAALPPRPSTPIPDDEASKGAPTVARYHAEGVRTVLVCCTGGEEGDILNPAMDTPEVRENIVASPRRESSAESAGIIGYDELVMLGYRDSGMPDSEANNDPRCFAKADFDEAVGRLVEVLRRERPQVIITYGDEQRGYPHPDHLRVHDISLPAFERAGDPEWYPEAGEPWQPLKIYYTIWSRARMEAVHNKMLELGLESPYDEQVVRPAVAGRSHHDPHRSRPMAVGASRCTCSRTRPRSTRRRRSGSGSPTRCSPSSIRGKTGCSRGASWAHLPEGEIEHDLFAGVRSEARESA